MKHKRILIPVFLLLCAFLMSAGASGAIDLDAPAYVVDDAGVLSDSLEKKIISANQSLENNCGGAQFCVVTVKYCPDGLDREEYAVNIFDTWNLGDASRNNGMLLVLYTEEDEFWLEAGYGIMSSRHVNEIADMVADDSTFYKNLQNDRDEEAVSGLLNDLLSWFEEYEQVSSASTSSQQSYSAPAHQSTYYPQETSSSGSGFGSMLLLIIVLLIITSPVRCRRRYGHWGIWPLFYFSPWWVTRPRMNSFSRRGPGGGGGGFGGSSHSSFGGSSHSSFGGSSHSSFGGGSSFRGGGGRSGGGFGGGGGGFHGGGGHSGGGFGHR